MSPANETLMSAFEQHGLTTGFLLTLFSTQELALAVNLKRKYAVQLETCQHGIFCDTWLAARNAQHESHCKLSCFYTQPSAVTQICRINEHLTALLHESAGGAQ
ncbi:hypothetical protein ACE3G8_04065 [Vreelandella venusta]